MTRLNMDRQDLELLERVLDVYGADRDRWPAAERLRLARVLTESEEARRMLRDAAALDRLLDLAPAFDAARQAQLAERIVARAAAMPRLAHAGPATEVARGPLARLPSLSRFGRVAPAAALLAASLMLGVFAGWQSGDLYPGLRPAALETAEATDGAVLPEIVLDDTSIEEELL